MFSWLGFCGSRPIIIHISENNWSFILFVRAFFFLSSTLHNSLNFAAPPMAFMKSHDTASCRTVHAFASSYHLFSDHPLPSLGTSPNCIIGVVNWVHGTYVELSNGSIVTTPFGDGYQQIENPCIAQSNFIETYNLTEIYQYWAVNLDPVDGYKLQLFQFDGTPLAPMFLISTTPTMLPTRLLRNTTADNVITVTSDGLVTTQTVGATLANNGAAKMTGAALGVGLVGLMVGLAGASLL